MKTMQEVPNIANPSDEDVVKKVFAHATDAILPIIDDKSIDMFEV